MKSKGLVNAKVHAVKTEMVCEFSENHWPFQGCLITLKYGSGNICTVL